MNTRIECRRAKFRLDHTEYGNGSRNADSHPLITTELHFLVSPTNEK